jgi:multisubunit Na+/H+ antiporter MnhB subunit
VNWKLLLGTMTIVVLISVYEWPRIKQTKEKIAFAVLTAIGCLLAALLALFPNMPSADQFVSTIYRPLGKLLE